ncbi:TPA: LuxR family transcriptional regulator [Serratia odorifera]|nr:LuxR family transcriptional regulator [Serratia odorifera]
MSDVKRYGGKMNEIYNRYASFRIDNFSQLDEVLAERCQAIGFDGYLLGVTGHGRDINQAVVLTNHPPAWRETYTRLGYINTDPTVAHCLGGLFPLEWQACPITAETAPFWQEASYYGLAHGVSFPLHGVQGEQGILSLSLGRQRQRDYRELMQQRWGELYILRDILLHHCIRLLDEKNKLTATVLSPREIEVCKWFTIGKTTWEISRILNCSEANVNFHFKNIRRKFNVSSRGAAIIKAIASGSLTL